MSMPIKGAFVTGDVARVEELVTAGSIVPGTLCVTSVGDKLCVVRKDNTVSVLSYDEHIFASLDEAQAYVTDANSGAKDGQIITVKEDDAYKQYIVNAGNDGALGLEEYVGSGATPSNPMWEEL